MLLLGATGTAERAEDMLLEHESRATAMTPWGDGCYSDRWSVEAWATYYSERDRLLLRLRRLRGHVPRVVRGKGQRRNRRGAAAGGAS